VGAPGSHFTMIGKYAEEVATVMRGWLDR